MKSKYIYLSVELLIVCLPWPEDELHEKNDYSIFRVKKSTMKVVDTQFDNYLVDINSVPTTYMALGFSVE